MKTTIHIPAGDVTLTGDLIVPPGAKGIILFAHGSGSSRLSPRNRLVAAQLEDSGFASLLFDLLTPKEEVEDDISGALRFDIEFLAGRLSYATDHVVGSRNLAKLPIGYFGASTGAAAAIVASVRYPEYIKAVVSRGGRPDLAEEELSKVSAPTLLIVGGNDREVITMNQRALSVIKSVKKLQIVDGATHLFEEAGALEEVAVLAASWFGKYLVRQPELAGDRRQV